MASGSIGSAVLDEGGSGSTHSSSLQFWHFPVYGENACVLEGRHGGLVRYQSFGGGEWAMFVVWV